MNAQHAPAPGDDIWSQHSCRFPAVQTELNAAHSKKGGIIVHKNHTESSDKTIFRGDEKRFCLAHAIIPVVLTGGGRLGCLPGTYPFSNELFINYLIYLSTKAILRLNQFINAEITNEKNK